MRKSQGMSNLKAALEQIGPVEAYCIRHQCQLYRVPSGELSCEKCAEETRTLEAEQNREVEKNWLVQRAVRELALPQRLDAYDFRSFIARLPGQKTVLNVCREFVGNWPNVGGLVMIGGVGAGKTHLAVSICKELCKRGVICRLETISRIIREIRSTWKGGNESMSEQDVIDKFSGLDLLVIDEIGAQYGTDSERVLVTEIINNRYERMKPTILIGNVKRSELEALVGVRVVDRVLHGGALLVFDWESQRKPFDRRNNKTVRK